MISSLNERLGQKGYTMVARVPQLGLSELADGSWHVMGGSSPIQPELMHEIEPDLIPFILSQGGDIVLYRLSDQAIGLAKPVLSRGGMHGRPPELSAVHSFDLDLVRRISDLQAARAKPVAPPKPAKVQPRIDRRAAACVLTGISLLFGAAAYLAMPSALPGGWSRWVPDMTNPRDVAILKGATVMAMPSKNDPNTLDMYRIYPGTPGTPDKGARDQVGSFKKRDLEHWSGDLPDSRVDWRRNF